MIGPLFAIMLAAQPASPPEPIKDTTDATETTAATTSRLAAEIAIKTAETDLASLSTPSPLLQRVLLQAKAAFAEGRYDDAVGYARRARASAGRRGREAAKTTEPATPVTAVMYDAMERLNAAENVRANDPKVVTARELVTAAEAAFASGNVTQSDQLCRRAIELLATLGPVSSRTDTPIVPVDPNEATQAELLKVPGMTADRVANLIWFRRYIGPLRRIEEIRFVPGFSSAFIPTARVFMRVTP